MGGVQAEDPVSADPLHLLGCERHCTRYGEVFLEIRFPCIEFHVISARAVRAPHTILSVLQECNLCMHNFNYTRTMLKLSKHRRNPSCSRHVLITHLSRTTMYLPDDSGTRPTLRPKCRISCLPSVSLLPKAAVDDNNYPVWRYDTQSS